MTVYNVWIFLCNADRPHGKRNAMPKLLLNLDFNGEKMSAAHHFVVSDMQSNSIILFHFYFMGNFACTLQNAADIRE